MNVKYKQIKTMGIDSYDYPFFVIKISKGGMIQNEY
nr:MAG TPA: hypothetical protein [Caudoviricetes sp.]